MAPIIFHNRATSEEEKNSCKSWREMAIKDSLIKKSSSSFSLCDTAAVVLGKPAKMHLSCGTCA